MSWVRVVDGKLAPMAEVYGFWSEAIQQGVSVLGFSIRQFGDNRWMAAEIAKERIPAPVRRAAAAAITIDQEISTSLKMTPTVIARAALMGRLGRWPVTVELANYRRLLVIALLQRVAPDPPGLLEALAKPYE